MSLELEYPSLQASRRRPPSLYSLQLDRSALLHEPPARFEQAVKESWLPQRAGRPTDNRIRTLTAEVWRTCLRS